MSSKPWVLIWVFISIMLLELYSLFPVSDKLFRPFPFSGMAISFQSWADYAAKIAAVAVLLWQLRNNTPRYYNELNAFLWLMVGYLADYFLIYNEPFGSFVVIGLKIYLSYTLFMVLLSGFIIYKAWTR